MILIVHTTDDELELNQCISLDWIFDAEHFSFSTNGQKSDGK